MAVNPMIVNVHSSKIVNQIYFKNIAKKFNLKPSELCVLIALSNHYNALKKDIFPTQEYIAEHCNISEKSVNRAVKRLSTVGVIIYETKHNNRYVFTNIFFEALEMSETSTQNVLKEKVKMSDKHISKHVNNTSNKSFKKISYLNPIQTKENMNKNLDIKTGSPLDLSKDKQINWYNNLPVFAKNSYFAKEIRTKWNL